MVDKGKERRGLLDDVEQLHERRKRKKEPKPKGELDLDGVWRP